MPEFRSEGLASFYFSHCAVFWKSKILLHSFHVLLFVCSFFFWLTFFSTQMSTPHPIYCTYCSSQPLRQNNITWPFASRSAAAIRMHSEIGGASDELIMRTTTFSGVLDSTLTFWSSSQRPFESNLGEILIMFCLLNVPFSWADHNNHPKQSQASAGVTVTVCWDT